MEGTISGSSSCENIYHSTIWRILTISVRCIFRSVSSLSDIQEHPSSFCCFRRKSTEKSQHFYSNISCQLNSHSKGMWWALGNNTFLTIMESSLQGVCCILGQVRRMYVKPSEYICDPLHTLEVSRRKRAACSSFQGVNGFTAVFQSINKCWTRDVRS